MKHRAILMVALLSACSSDAAPVMAGSEDPVEMSSSGGEKPDAVTEGTSGAQPGSSGGEDEADASTGAVFIVEPDAGQDTHECDLFAQDCDPGQKCMPWANDGGSSWNATRCVDVADNPGQGGDECTVEGSGVSGFDDCDVGVMCWDVDPETNVGLCVPMCTGDESNPICEDPDTSCAIANDGVIVLCLPNCDPLLQDCEEGQACYPLGDGWNCAPDASGEGGVYGDPCEYINVCDPGLICLGASALPAGLPCEGAVGCCSEVCATDAPEGDAQCTGAPAGQQCLPWYEEGSAPPGYENVGACALPG